MKTLKQILEREDTDQIIKAAYWYGQHVGAKRVCDKYRSIRQAQIERANGVRYHHEAKRVLGNTDLIHDASYGDSEIGGWDYDIKKELG